MVKVGTPLTKLFGSAHACCATETPIIEKGKQTLQSIVRRYLGLMGKRELIALLNLSSWCLVMVERLFLAVPRGCLQFVIVVFPDHTHLLFLVCVLCSGISWPYSFAFCCLTM